jgi:nucleoside-diphosphate-sugar epimerase
LIYVRQTDDYNRDIVQPPLDIESSLLNSALSAPSVRRVVITSSAVTLIPMSWLASSDVDTVFSSQDLNKDTAPPYNNAMEAYWASKGLARKHVHEFLSQKKPHFDIIQLLPSVVLGPDDWAKDLETFFAGTRAMILPIIQGKVMDVALVGAPVFVDDVALAHVDAIKSSIPGNKDYILSSDTPDGIEWNSILDIARQHFPHEVESGLLQCTGSLPTRRWKLDASDTEKAFGWKFTSFEDTMRKQLQQYITLSSS